MRPLKGDSLRSERSKDKLKGESYFLVLPRGYSKTASTTDEPLMHGLDIQLLCLPDFETGRWNQIGLVLPLRVWFSV